MNLKSLAFVGLLGVFVLPATAAPISFSAGLSGPAEEPANASPGTGFTLVTIDPVAHTLRVQVDFAGLVSTTVASHIHVVNGPGDLDTTDTRGPVATTVPTFPEFPLGAMSGTYDMEFNTLAALTYNPSFVIASGGDVSVAEAQLFDAIMTGRAYLNIHTAPPLGFPAGEIRGFLAPVPEPATVGLCAIALGAFAVLKRHRRTV
jgi:hypothetical protein